MQRESTASRAQAARTGSEANLSPDAKLLERSPCAHTQGGVIKRSAHAEQETGELGRGWTHAHAISQRQKESGAKVALTGETVL